ncbi:MAG TPA: SdpI family protein [Chitinophagaceae bacterium]
MKSNIAIRNAGIFLVALIPIAYLAIIWNKIPAQVIMHYNARLEPDRIGNKSELWVLTGIIAGISFLVYLLLQNIHLFDPKRKTKDASAVFNKLAIGLVVFMAALSCVFILSAKEGEIVISRFLFPLLGLMFAFIGNYMHSIKPNYFAGFRLPWTLNDDENWRKTHKLGGKLWFWGGLGFAMISLFVPQKFILYLFIPLMIVMVIIPFVYSFRLYKLKKNNPV